MDPFSGEKPLIVPKPKKEAPPRRQGPRDYSKISPTKPLSSREEALVVKMAREELPYAIAAGPAGFPSPQAAYNALRKPNVQRRLAELRAEFARDTQMTRKKVLDGMTEAINMAKIKTDALAMIAGWREIARLCGFYEAQKHRIEVSVNGQVVIQKLQAMADHELMRLVDGNVIDGEIIGPKSVDNVLQQLAPPSEPVRDSVDPTADLKSSPS